MSAHSRMTQKRCLRFFRTPTHDTSLKSWSEALEEIEGWPESFRHLYKETEEHAIRVTEMTVSLARMMAVPENKIVHIRRGAMLHDIGRLGIPDEILLKPGELSEQDWEIMRKHPDYAYELLYPIEYLRPCLSIPCFHHERWDGSGYSHGLQGEQIPLEARIFAIVDVYDALVSDRPYRIALPKEQARGYILANAGSLFDSVIVTVFMNLLEKREKHYVPP